MSKTPEEWAKMLDEIRGGTETGALTLHELESIISQAMEQARQQEREINAALLEAAIEWREARAPYMTDTGGDRDLTRLANAESRLSEAIRSRQSQPESSG